MIRARTLAPVALAIGFIAFLTLTPQPPSEVLPPYCIACGRFGTLDLVLNVALFLPLGAALYWLTGRWGPTLATGLAVTLLVEVLQLRVVPGRDASLGDLLANGAGTALGAWLAVRGPAWLAATGRAARSLCRRFAAVAVAVVGASAWLLVPARPSGPLAARLSPPRPEMERISGQVTRLELNGTALPAGWPVPPGLFLPHPADTTRVRVGLGGALRPTRTRAHIASVANPGQQGFVLAQRGDDAVFQVWVRASAVRLRAPLVALRGAFTVPDSARPLVVDASSDRATVRLTRHVPGDSAFVVMPRSIGMAWTVLTPWDVAVDPRWWPANAAWLGALAFPAAFFAARARPAAGARRAPGPWLDLSIVPAAMVVAPWMARLAPLAPAEWAGVVAGVAGAVALGRLTSDART